VLDDLPPGAHAEHHPPAADVVDRGRRLHQHRGVAVGVAGHQRAQPHPRDGRGQPGEQGEDGAVLAGGGDGFFEAGVGDLGAAEGSNTVATWLIGGVPH